MARETVLRGIAAALLALALAGCGGSGRAGMEDVPAAPVPPVLAGASTGTYAFDCGDAGPGHRNADNMITSPGQAGAAHHLHEYVGNVSTGADSTTESLAAAGTTCANGDRSAYYWPVLRTGEPHHGEVRAPSTVELTFRGSPTGKVIPFPQGLRMLAGNAKAVSSGGAYARPSWSCEGFRDRVTNAYPHCPDGVATLRIHDYPSCWDGRRTDSPDHRAHLAYPDPANGNCPQGTFAVPQLRLVLSYDLDGDDFTVDTFPEEKNSAAADHADAVCVLPDEVMARVVECLNSGESC